MTSADRKLAAADKIASESRKKSELRRRAVKEAGPIGALDMASMRPGEAERLLHELRVHQIELELQNEELRCTQEALEASRARFFDLYDLAPVGYITLGETNLILEANLRAATLLGRSRRPLLNQMITRFIVPEDHDIFDLHRKKLFKTGEPTACELRMKRPDGGQFWAHLDATIASDDSTGVTVCLVTLSDITERKRAEEEIGRSLAEKEVLLREIHHRVKNNLVMVLSILRLSMKKNFTPDVDKIFAEVRDRIYAIELIHELLYSSRDISSIDLGEYLDTLAQKIWAAHAAESRARLERTTSSVIVNIDQATQCGLVVSELIINALKHGFTDDRTGVIRLAVGEEEGLVRVAVLNDGTPLLKDHDITKGGSFGLRLVKSIVTDQIKGNLEIRHDPETEFVVTFKKKPAHRSAVPRG